MLINWKEVSISNIKMELLAGVVVALALIPEAISFSIIAGVDPKVGLYSSFCICVVIAAIGGRSGMISGATGAMALLMVTLVREHGLQYLLAATILTGILQVAAGYLRLGNLMRFVSSSVITGFVNALAILIFLAQLPELTHVTWHVYALTLVGLAIIYLFPLIPYLGKSVPSPLVCILTLTALSIMLGLDVRTVGDMGKLPETLPVFLWPEVPLTFQTLVIIFPYSLALATVGLLESLMTARIVDDLSQSFSNKDRECKGQGVANVISGFLGGMAGCAMIGQSVVNFKSGGRSRLSCFSAGIFLLMMVVFIGDWLARIPMAALVAVMIMVSVSTFSWRSLKEIKSHPFQSNVVMLSTVFFVVLTHNLAIGVLAGIVLATLFFVQKIGDLMRVDSVLNNDISERTYTVKGQVFFASANEFIMSFNTQEQLDTVTIDLSHAHFWDICAVTALDKVVIQFRKRGAKVGIIGVNEACATIISRFSIHDKPQEAERLLAGH